jgi:hypothetical protein
MILVEQAELDAGRRSSHGTAANDAATRELQLAAASSPLCLELQPALLRRVPTRGVEQRARLVGALQGSSRGHGRSRMPIIVSVRGEVHTEGRNPWIYLDDFHGV